LIDNSIDAARNTMLQKTPKMQEPDQLPDSYSGFSVTLEVLGDRIEIVDNCGGMDPQGLASGYLRFGKQSEHEYGIGLYGVGLNRALFKLGNNTEIKTENASGCAKVAIDRIAYIKDEDNWNITGETLTPAGTNGTRILITTLDPEISHQTSSPEWRGGLIAEMEKRRRNLNLGPNDHVIGCPLCLIPLVQPIDSAATSQNVTNDVALQEASR